MYILLHCSNFEDDSHERVPTPNSRGKSRTLKEHLASFWSESYCSDYQWAEQTYLHFCKRWQEVFGVSVCPQHGWAHVWQVSKQLQHVCFLSRKLNYNVQLICT